MSSESTVTSVKSKETVYKDSMRRRKYYKVLLASPKAKRRPALRGIEHVYYGFDKLTPQMRATVLFISSGLTSLRPPISLIASGQRYDKTFPPEAAVSRHTTRSSSEEYLIQIAKSQLDDM